MTRGFARNDRRGVQYVDVILDREHADHIVEHLRQLNPAIKLAERRGV
ncbi:MAG: hypothetical protein J6T07_04395 [Bacteroidales bacterium]|nr:hypothetical protein [Bacteroidales bacterium]